MPFVVFQNDEGVLEKQDPDAASRRDDIGIAHCPLFISLILTDRSSFAYCLLPIAQHPPSSSIAHCPLPAAAVNPLIENPAPLSLILTVICPPLTITFLGTGTSSGVPMIACDCSVCTSTDKKDNRLRSSILVQSATTTLVVDTTPDFRYQMLRAGVKKLDAVIYTHAHKDHLAGLDDIRAFNYFNRSAVNVYADDLTQRALKNEFYYVFAEHKYPGIPEIILNDIDGTAFMIGDIPVQPIKVWHLNMPVYGFRFGGFTYITDANRIEEQEKEKIKGSDILVLNALRYKKHISHFTLPEALEMADELAVPQAFFTHISHQLGRHKDVNETLNSHRLLAYDMQEIHLESY